MVGITTEREKPEMIETDRTETRYSDMGRADVCTTLWIELRQAHFAATSARAERLQLFDRGYRDGLRDGLLIAYAMLTGQSEVDVYESLQDDLTD